MTITRKRRRRRIVSLAILAGYGLLMAFGGCADQLLLYPSRDPIDTPGLTRVAVATPNGDVEAWTTEASASPVPDAFVLNFTGNASRGEYEAPMVAEDWAGHPVEIWSVNYPGYGGSTGPAKLSSIAPAALAVYDQLALRAAGRPIFLSGRSLGTTAALYVAAHRPAAGMVLQNPPPLQTLILERHGWWNLWLLAGPVALGVPADLNSLRNAPRVTIPAVFIMAGSDSIVPPRYQQMVVAAYAGPKKLVPVPGADHNDPLDPASTAELHDAIDWLIQTAKR